MFVFVANALAYTHTRTPSNHMYRVAYICYETMHISDTANTVCVNKPLVFTMCARLYSFDSEGETKIISQTVKTKFSPSLNFVLDSSLALVADIQCVRMYRNLPNNKIKWINLKKKKKYPQSFEIIINAIKSHRWIIVETTKHSNLSKTVQVTPFARNTHQFSFYYFCFGFQFLLVECNHRRYSSTSANFPFSVFESNSQSEKEKRKFIYGELNGHQNRKNSKSKITFVCSTNIHTYWSACVNLMIANTLPASIAI